MSGRERLEMMVDSASVYFTEQFESKESFIFRLAPEVTLSNELEYYGANSPNRRDELIYKAVMESCLAVDDEVDFSGYDYVMLLTAGQSEIDGGGDDHIWPQQSFLSDWGVSFSLDSKVIDAFSVSTESCGVGTLCHEFAHNLGLVDLYDTDGPGSGGRANALWGEFALMDRGNRASPVPPCFSSVEMLSLGIGKCETLKKGEYTLAPLSREKRFLKAEGSNPDEFFLMECRFPEGWDRFLPCRGLVIYHVDLSENDAGWSDFYMKNLSAAERWQTNQVNCNPGYQCANLVEAIPGTHLASLVSFPQLGASSFSSATEPPFIYNSGEASKFALSSIGINGDGSVSFKVSEPVSIKSTAVFQDAAIISWECDGSVEGILTSEVSWSDAEGKSQGKARVPEGMTYTAEGLTPGTQYRFTVRITSTEAEQFSTWVTLTTKNYRQGSQPYIELGSAERNSDGSLKKGSRIPLRITNMPGTVSYSWTIDGKVITPESDGFYTLNSSGALKVVAEDVEGRINVIVKEVTVK